MAKTLETKFERLVHERRDIGIIIAFLSESKAPKTKEDISKYFTSKGRLTDEKYIDTLLEVAGKNQLIHYGVPVYRKKSEEKRNSSLIKGVFKEEKYSEDLEKIDTYILSKAGKRIYRGGLCQQEQAQQI